MAKIENPKVFISYCWSNEEYINKVVDFAKRLRSNGIDVVLDQFQMKLGNDMNNFMEKCVNDKTITNVLILLSPDYKTKADSRSGGAGIETQIISGEVYSNVENTKFIPILFEKRGEDTSACIPTYLKQRRWLDMSEDSDFERQYIELVRALYGNDKFVENPLGAKPEWVDETNDNTANSQIVVNTYKALKKEYGNDRAIANSFDSLKKVFLEVRKQFENIKTYSYDDFDKFYPIFLKLRDPFLSFFDEIKYDNKIGEKLHDLYLDLYQSVSESRTNYPVFVIFSRIFIHELFIETIALLIKAKNFTSINYLTSVPYIDFFSYKRELASFRNVFYSISKVEIYNFDEYLGHKLQKDPLKGPYYSGIAEYWMRNMPIRFINEVEFSNADCLLTNISIAISDDYWFALSYVYLPDRDSSLIREIALSLTSKKLANKFYVLFDVNSIDEMKSYIERLQFYSDNGRHVLSYTGAFYSIPLLTKYIKKDELESK